MIEQEIIQACKNEMWKRFPRDKIVIGRPAAISQYDRGYLLYGIVLQPCDDRYAHQQWLGTPMKDGETFKAVDPIDDVKGAFVGITGAWFDDLRDRGSVLVVRRALEYSEEPIEGDSSNRLRHRVTFRAHAANDIMLYTPDYAEKMGDTSHNPELGDYMERMRKALA